MREDFLRPFRPRIDSFFCFACLVERRVDLSAVRPMAKRAEARKKAEGNGTDFLHALRLGQSLDRHAAPTSAREPDEKKISPIDSRARILDRSPFEIGEIELDRLTIRSLSIYRVRRVRVVRPDRA